MKTTTRHSTDFGWKANQDVTGAFTKLLQDGTLKAGDECVLDHTYRIDIMSDSQRALPDHFTLSAVKGAGFAVYGFTHDAEPGSPVLELGDRNTVRNVTMTCEGVPTEIRVPGRKAKFFDGVGILATDRKDILIENCRLSGLIRHNVQMRNCRRPKIIGCHIVGGFWSVHLGATDAIVWRCLFERSTCDSLKTGGGTRRMLVENCVFQDNDLGDGIDTTGGFSDSVVRHSIFRRLRTFGIDVKSFTGGQVPVKEQNTNIRVENCLFHDIPNAISFSVTDESRRRGQGDFLTCENIRAYAPHDIDIVDCVFGHAERPLRNNREGGYGVVYPKKDEYMRCILLSHGYNIRYRDIRLSGERIIPFHIKYPSSSELEGPSGVSKEALPGLGEDKDKVTGNVLDEAALRIKPGVMEAPFDCGPQPLDQ